MRQPRGYLAYGGGLGDVVWDYTHDRAAAGLAARAERGSVTRVLTQCHNPAVRDVFRHHPFIAEHVVEEWQPPTPEEYDRLQRPIDGYDRIPCDLTEERQPGAELYLSPEEREELDALLSGGPVVVVQPYAGQTMRNAMTPATLRQFVDALSEAHPGVRVAVVGFNHHRGESRQHTEEVGFTHLAVVDLIDRTGIRFNYHLTARAAGYVGSFSNLVRTAWDFRRPNVVVLDAALSEHGIPRTDPRYSYGWPYPDTRLQTFDAIDTLDVAAVVDFLSPHLSPAP